MRAAGPAAVHAELLPVGRERREFGADASNRRAVSGDAVARPEIFNRNQRSQFTAAASTSRLEACGVAVSMDGRGQAIDNVFVERLWRSMKYGEVYLREYVDGWEAEERLGAYFRFYSHERVHQALGYRTPADVYRQRG